MEAPKRQKAPKHLDQGKHQQRKKALARKGIEGVVEGSDDAGKTRQGDGNLGVRLEKGVRIQSIAA
jgi:hypothetical protein